MPPHDRMATLPIGEVIGNRGQVGCAGQVQARKAWPPFQLPEGGIIRVPGRQVDGPPNSVSWLIQAKLPECPFSWRVALGHPAFSRQGPVFQEIPEGWISQPPR